MVKLIPAKKNEFRSVLKTWLVSYVLILLIPIFTSWFQYFYTNSVIVKEINATNENLLNNIHNNVDGILKTLESSNTSIFFDDHIKQLFYLNRKDKQFPYELTSCVERLYVHNQANPSIDVMIYMPQEQYIIHSYTANRISYIYDSLKAKGINLTEKTWIDSLDNYYGGSYVLSTGFSYKNFGEDSIVFCRSVPLSTRQKTLANIFVSVPCSTIEAISDVSLGSFLILNDNGDIIKSFSNMALPDRIKLTKPEGTDTLRIKNKTYILSYVKSNQNNWYYAVITSKSDFWKQANYIKISTLVSLFITLLIGGCSIFWLLRRNYRPVHDVVRMIKNTDSDSSKDEFDLIQKAYLTLYKENSTMRNNLTKQMEHSREIYLVSKLKGVTGHLTDEDSTEFFQLSIDGKKYALVSCYHHYSEDDIRKFNNDWLSYHGFISFVIENIFSELLDKKYDYYHLDDGELILYLFILEETNYAAWESYCYEKLTALYEYLQKTFDIPLTITIGEICDNFENIHNYYEDVISGHEYNCMIQKDGIVKVKDIAEPNHHEDQQKNKNERLLKETLQLCNYRKAAAITDTIFEELPCKDDTSFYRQKFYIYHLINNLLTASPNGAEFNSLDGNMDPKQTICINKNLQTLLDNILLCSNMGALKKAFLNLLKAFCGMSQETYEERMQELTHKIKNYIYENYMDCNLSLALIADAMNLNPKYMSRLFKDENEEGLLDYINTVRIQKAKAILTTQSITLEELAVAVGYTNVRTFRRAFLKIEGTTPSQYRKWEKE